MKSLEAARARRGRPPGSRNKRTLFECDRCMDILHEVAARPQNARLTVYQVLDEAAREIIKVMLERKPHDEQFRESQLERVRKQLQRDQEANDGRYFTAVGAAQENFASESEVYDNHDPEDGPHGPPPQPWEMALTDHIASSEEDFRTLPQGYAHAAKKDNFVVLDRSKLVKKRSLKNRSVDYLSEISVNKIS